MYSTRELEAVWARRESAPLLLLVVVGKVYNVSAGRAFYGSVGAGYEGFASGADHTRAFLTADFEHNATDDLGNLTHAQLLGVAHWAQFYEDHAVYKYAGVHVGRFYDAQGHATAARRVYEVSVAAAKVNPGALTLTLNKALTLFLTLTLILTLTLTPTPTPTPTLTLAKAERAAHAARMLAAPRCAVTPASGPGRGVWKTMSCDPPQVPRWLILNPNPNPTNP